MNILLTEKKNGFHLHLEATEREGERIHLKSGRFSLLVSQYSMFNWTHSKTHWKYRILISDSRIPKSANSNRIQKWTTAPSLDCTANLLSNSNTWIDSLLLFSSFDFLECSFEVQIEPTPQPSTTQLCLGKVTARQHLTWTHSRQSNSRLHTLPTILLVHLLAWLPPVNDLDLLLLFFHRENVKLHNWRNITWKEDWSRHGVWWGEGEGVFKVLTAKRCEAISTLQFASIFGE